MKILLSTLQYEYGDPSRGPECIGEHGFRKALLAIGHEVHPFYLDPYLHDPHPAQEAILTTATSLKPDLIFFLTVTNQFSPQTLDLLNQNYCTAAWFGDDTWRFDSYTRHYAPHYRWCITTDPFALQKYREIGVERVILSQWAAIDSYPPVDAQGYERDVAFVGGISPEREWFVRELLDRGIQVETFGHGWPQGGVSLLRMREIFATSRINLNLSNSTCYDIRFHLSRRQKATRRLKGILRFAISRKMFLDSCSTGKSMGQIKARNFEIPYYGGFQLTDYYPGIEDYFELGREIACFRDLDEAALLIQHYLAEESRREAIRQAGHQRALREHGYRQRLAEILGRIFK